MEESPAELWVFVLRSFKKNEPDFVILPKAELCERLSQFHSFGNREIQSYICSTESDSCWEVRVPDHEQVLGRIADGAYNEPNRDFTKYLNDAGWKALTKRLER